MIILPVNGGFFRQGIAPDSANNGSAGVLFTRRRERRKEMVAFLRKEPLGMGPPARVEPLLDSPNPWIAWLGLVRLGKLGALRTEHFARAVRSRVPDDAEAIVRELLHAASTHDTMRGDLPRQLVRLGATPAMEEAVLREVVKAIRGQGDARIMELRRCGHPIDIPPIQKAAREYREEIDGKPAYNGVVRQLDALIALP